MRPTEPMTTRVQSEQLSARHATTRASALSSTMLVPQQYLPSRQVAGRYCVSLMALHRWRARKINPLPPPLVIAGRNYWSEQALQQWDQANAAAVKAI